MDYQFDPGLIHTEDEDRSQFLCFNCIWYKKKYFELLLCYENVVLDASKCNRGV